MLCAGSRDEGLHRSRWPLVVALLTGAAVLAGMVVFVPATARAQAIGEVLSKAEALRLFRMTKPQWEETVSKAVAAGTAVATPPSPSGFTGMTVQTQDSSVTTRLGFYERETKPRAVQVVVMYPAGQPQPVLTDELAREMVEETKRQMAPQFIVTGEMDRVDGGLAFSFMIREARP